VNWELGNWYEVDKETPGVDLASFSVK